VLADEESSSSTSVAAPEHHGDADENNKEISPKKVYDVVKNPEDAKESAKKKAKDIFKSVGSPKQVLNITWDTYVIGIVLVAIGILLTFSGKRFFKIFLGCSGFLAGALLAVNLLAIFENLIYTFEEPKWIYICFAGVLGLLAAALCFFLWEIGVLACAGFGGYSLAIWIMSMQAGGVIEGYISRGAFITAVTVMAIILAWFFDNIAIIIASALAGALSIVVGFDCFVNWGFIAVLTNIVLPGHFAKLASLDIYCYIEIAAVAVLAVLGLVVQFLTGGKGKGYSRSDKV
jgi:hypothetical protein